ncbi:MAG: DUF5777 family beta-barrel protein [Flavisolibacter sp.]
MHKRNGLLSLVFSLLFSSMAYSQDEDLLGMVEDKSPKKEYVYNAYKSSRVIMAQSMEMLRPGVLDFRILHRFGRINGGAYEFFGLDGPATVRLGLDYGISDNFTVGIGRSTFNKELDGFLKWRIIHQSTGPSSLPISLVAVAGTTVTTLKWSDPSRENYFTSRMAFYGQLIVGRRFSEGITLQVMPTIVHRNLVPNAEDPHDLVSVGAGARFKLTRRISFNLDYHYVLNQNESAGFHNPLSLGFDFETGGHVFQLHFTNSKGMNERSFLANTEYDWGNGDIFFGFNISRSFQIKKKRS